MVSHHDNQTLFREFSLLGLALIAIGTGGIKPCVSSFGGDQFKLPEQARQLQTFFSVFYFSINAGSLISTVLTPVLREVSTSIKAFDKYDLRVSLMVQVNECYPLYTVEVP